MEDVIWDTESVDAGIQVRLALSKIKPSVVVAKYRVGVVNCSRPDTASVFRLLCVRYTGKATLSAAGTGTQ